MRTMSHVWSKAQRKKLAYGLTGNELKKEKGLETQRDREGGINISAKETAGPRTGGFFRLLGGQGWVQGAILGRKHLCNEWYTGSKRRGLTNLGGRRKEEGNNP